MQIQTRRADEEVLTSSPGAGGGDGEAGAEVEGGDGAGGGGGGGGEQEKDTGAISAGGGLSEYKTILHIPVPEIFNVIFCYIHMNIVQLQLCLI